MIDHRSPEDRVLAWMESGPEVAPPEFTERTLRPIPRMRQRHSWRIGLERLGRPVARPLALGLSVALLLGLLIASVLWLGPAANPPPPPGPTMDLRLANADPTKTIVDTGPFSTDPTATTNTCVQLPDGFWKFDYSGGDPYVRVLLLVSPEAAAGGRSDEVSSEIVIGSPLTTLINVDQPGYRSGDAPGRSTAEVETTVAADAITFDLTARTPAASADFTDLDHSIAVDLTVVCPT